MNQKRVSWDEYFMNIAQMVATRSTCDRGSLLKYLPGRRGVGAVIVRNRIILSTGYNGSVVGAVHCDEAGHMMEHNHCVRTVHAEANAIAQAAKNGVNINEAIIYTTASPCWTCFKLICNAGIKKVVFGEFYRDERINEVANQVGIQLIDMSKSLFSKPPSESPPLRGMSAKPTEIVKFKKLFSDVTLPDYAHQGDAGLDLYSREDYILKPGERHTFPLGFVVEIPEGSVGLIWDRSGLAAEHGLKTFAGVLDSSYRGELKIVLYNSSNEPFSIHKGDKIAQLLIQPVARTKIEETTSLSQTERGEKGFGSTDIEVQTKEEGPKRW